MSRLATATRGQAGSALIEVLVSAVVLLLAAGASLSLMDNAGAVQSESRARVAAAALADQDQERMRAMAVATLGDSYTATRDVTVGNPPVTYTVASKAVWVDDVTNGDVGCNGTATQADYLSITSTETPKPNPGIAPVKVVSLVTPRVGTLGGTGSLVVPVKDRNGAAKSGIVVTVTGPRSGTAVTNGAGCAIFNYFPVGAYTARLNTTGYVNKLSQTDYTFSGQVNLGQVNPTSDQLYDQASAITASFDTQAPGASSSVATKALTLTVANSGVPNPDGGFRFNATGAAPGDSSITATSLFPFSGGWSIYAGSCGANDPAKYTGAPTNTVQVTPGVVTTAPTAVRVPTQRFTNLPSAVSGATKVVLTPLDTGCTQKFTTSGSLDAVAPYGKYKVCVSNASNKAELASVTNDTAAGKSVSMASATTTNGQVCS